MTFPRNSMALDLNIAAAKGLSVRIKSDEIRACYHLTLKKRCLKLILMDALLFYFSKKYSGTLIPFCS